VSGLASEDGHDTDPAEAAAKLADLLNGLFSSLDEIVVAFRGLLENANASGRPLRRSDLSALRPVLIRHLHQHQHLIMGTGVVWPTRPCGSSGGDPVRVTPRRR
jgi:hypothetical protein